MVYNLLYKDSSLHASREAQVLFAYLILQRTPFGCVPPLSLCHQCTGKPAASEPLNNLSIPAMLYSLKGLQLNFRQEEPTTKPFRYRTAELMRLEIRSRVLPITACGSPITYHHLFFSQWSSCHQPNKLCTLWTGSKIRSAQFQGKNYLDDIKLLFCWLFHMTSLFFIIRNFQSQKLLELLQDKAISLSLIFSKARVSHVNSSANPGIFS